MVGGGGGEGLAAIGNMFRNAAGSQARHKRNWKSPLVEKEAGVGGGGCQVEPGQEAVVPVFLFHNQQLADSQRSRLEGSHSSEHIRTVSKRWSRFCWGMSSGICSVKM